MLKCIQHAAELTNTSDSHILRGLISYIYNPVDAISLTPHHGLRQMWPGTVSVWACSASLRLACTGSRCDADDAQCCLLTGHKIRVCPPLKAPLLGTSPAHEKAGELAGGLFPLGPCGSLLIWFLSAYWNNSTHTLSWLRRGDVLEMTWGLTAGSWIAANCYRWSSLLGFICPLTPSKAPW